MMDHAEVKIDGRTLELVYEFNSLVDAETICGTNLLVALEHLGGALTAGQLRGLLFAMICPYRGFPPEPQDQLKVCGQFIRIDTIGPIVTALGEACAIAVSQEYAQRYREATAPEPEVVAEEPTPAAAEVVDPEVAKDLVTA